MKAPAIPFRKWWITAIPVALLVLFLMNPCSRNELLLTVLLTCTVLLSAWSTQYAMANGKIPARWFEYPFSLLYDLSFLLVIAFLLSVGLPTYHCYPDRPRVSEAISSISAVKVEVAEALLANKPVTPRELDDPPGFKNVAYLEVRKDGRILLVTQMPNARVRFTPERKGDSIRWTCRGRPEKHVPANCRL